MTFPPESLYTPDNLSDKQNCNNVANKFVHSPDLWQRAFARVIRGPEATRNLTRALRIIVLKQTQRAFEHGRYTTTSDGQQQQVQIDKNDLARCVQATRFHKDANEIDTTPFRNRFSSTTEVRVLEGDCLEAALRIRDECRNSGQPAPNVAVLNNASAKNPGGGYKSGAGAQEEYLCRCTSLSYCLEDPLNLDPQRAWTYPLDEYGGLFSSDVVVIRGKESDGYPFLAQPDKVGIITVAAYRHPPTTKNHETGELRLEHYIELGFINKIKAILNMCLQHGYFNVVLGAFGCGAYRCPPSEVARLFCQVLRSDEYTGCFERVHFAIIEDHNAGHAWNPQGNVKPFAEAFGVQAQKL